MSHKHLIAIAVSLACLIALVSSEASGQDVRYRLVEGSRLGHAVFDEDHDLVREDWHPLRGGFTVEFVEDEAGRFGRIRDAEFYTTTEQGFSGIGAGSLSVIANQDSLNGLPGTGLVDLIFDFAGFGRTTLTSEIFSLVSFPALVFPLIQINGGLPHNALGMDVFAEPLPEHWARFFRRGDVDGDARRNVTDAVVLLNALFLGAGLPTCADAADFDDNGEIDPLDAVSLLGFLFMNSAPPPIPRSLCGTDPTDDSLGCQGQYACEETFTWPDIASPMRAD